MSNTISLTVNVKYTSTSIVMTTTMMTTKLVKSYKSCTVKQIYITYNIKPELHMPQEQDIVAQAAVKTARDEKNDALKYNQGEK